VGRDGIEPPTPGFQILGSWDYRALSGPIGLQSQVPGRSCCDHCLPMVADGSDTLLTQSSHKPRIVADIACLF
jgi:hypothetical protein